MKRLAILALISLLPLAAPGELGHDVGHGGDYITTENNPWFIGPYPVSYCIEISPDFSATPLAAGAAIQNALTDWKATLQSLVPASTEANLLDGKPRTITTEFVKTDCGPNTDLTFLLGVITPQVIDDLRHRAQYTVAFAEQKAFSAPTGRARGFIWLVPDRGDERYQGPQSEKGHGGAFWSHAPTLYNVILHELGHVMGFQHQAGAMAATLPGDVVASGNDLLYTSQLYVAQRWTRTSDRAGRSVCGNVLASSTGMIAQLLGEDDSVRGWLACLQWDRASSRQLILSLMPQDGGKRSELPIHELSEYRTRSLRDVSGCYRRNDQPEGAFPSCHSFIDPYSDVLLTALRGNGATYSTVITTNQTGIRLNLIDASQQNAGWIGIYFNQSYPAPVAR